ncbi:MAG: metal-dependent hydrolase [Peptostreptococcaceae bacterium]|nr:metal-dependent hydrolase [Peptostreptococcaceae bacterium]
MKLHYYGHSAFRLTGENFNLLIDPFLLGNPLCETDPKTLDGITHILVTHGHGDHIGDTASIAKQNNSLIVCNAEMASFFSNMNLKTHAMHIGGAYQFCFGRVKMTQAAHGSGIQTTGGIICGGNPCGFLIEADGRKIYHAGDTGLIWDMKLLEDEHVDYALLPIGGNFTMDVADAVRAVDFIKPKTSIPMHYNTFPLIEASPELFKTSVQNNHVIILKPNTAIDI